MTREDHERERRAFWDACCAEAPTYGPQDSMSFREYKTEADFCAQLADAKLAERDKRFPAPIGGE